MRPTLLVSALLAALGAACSKKSADQRPHVPGAIAHDALQSAWSRAGLTPDTFAPVVDAGAWSAVSCSEGTVAGLKALLCDYATDDVLAEGQRLMNEQLSRDTVFTGVVVRNGRTLLSVTDRSHADPSSRTASRMVKAFNAQK